MEIQHSQLKIKHYSNTPSTKAAGGGIFSGVFTQGRPGTTQGQEDFELSWYLFFQQSFHQNKTCFVFGQEVASPSLFVVSHKRNLLISVSLECPDRCTFCQRYFPLHNICFGVLVNADNTSKMNPVFSMIFHTNTIIYTDA